MLLLRLLILAILIIPHQVLASDFHVEASRVAIVRELPSIESNEFARLEAGNTAACLVVDDKPHRHNNFIHIRLADGRSGWVSRYRVRLREGISPTALARAIASSEDELRAYHLEIGKPIGYMEIVNDGYIVAYDPRLKIPAWVQYRLRASDLENPVPRSDAFADDVRVPRSGRALLADYAEAASWDLWNALDLQPQMSRPPAYARGHMAPARDMSRSEEIERSSNHLSNIVPQVHVGYNNGVWSTLEARIRRWVEHRGELTIITGPVFVSSDRQLTPPKQDTDRIAAAESQGLIVLAQPPTDRQVVYNVVGQGEVAVPTAFFKVVVDYRNPEDPDVLAFLIPHHRHTSPDLSEFLVSVREIERLTGLNLLSGLPREIQDDVESEPSSLLWPLQ